MAARRSSARKATSTAPVARKPRRSPGRQGTGKTRRRMARNAAMRAPFTREERALGRNEIMRRYIAGSTGFTSDARTALQFVAQDHVGGVPDYGEQCEAYLEQVMTELRRARG